MLAAMFLTNLICMLRRGARHQVTFSLLPRPLLRSARTHPGCRSPSAEKAASCSISPTKSVQEQLTSMAAADYNGSISISGSSFTQDNKTIPVVLHVTTQPILQAAP